MSALSLELCVNLNESNLIGVNQVLFRLSIVLQAFREDYEGEMRVAHYKGVVDPAQPNKIATVFFLTGSEKNKQFLQTFKLQLADILSAQEKEGRIKDGFTLALYDGVPSYALF